MCIRDRAYNARYEASEAPAMTSVALSVQKAEGSVAILDDVSREDVYKRQGMSSASAPSPALRRDSRP